MFRLFRQLFNIFRRSPSAPPDSVESNDSAKLASGSAAEATDSSGDSVRSVDNPAPKPPENTSEPQDAPVNAVVSEGPTMPAENSRSQRSTRSQRSNDSSEKTSLKDLKIVLNVLRAYVVTFGQPDNELKLRAVVGAIAANVQTVEVENERLEAFIDEAITAYESLGTDASFVDVTAQLLAEQVAVWLKEQETTVSNVVSAYLQQFAPEDATWEEGELLSLMQTVVATLNDGSLTKSGGRALINQVIETFDLERALSRWIAPEWVALAQRVASYEDKSDIQDDIRSIAWAYIRQFESILSPQLIEQIMEEGPINVSPDELLSGDLGDFSEMLFYKYQLLEADPVVTKSHEAIAANVHKAVEDFRKRQKKEGGIDLTVGDQSGELEVSSPFFGKKKD